MLKKIMAIFLFGFGLLLVQPVNAKQVKSAPRTKSVTFQILPEFPKDNIGGQHSGYFNLKLKQGQTRQVRIKLLNPTTKALTVKTEVSDALMNEQMQPTYLGQAKQKVLVKKRLSQQLEMPRSIRIPAGKQRWLTVKIKGDAKFNGQKAAALNLISENKAQGAIRNRFIYTIAVIGNGQKIKHYQKLKLTKISTKLINHKPAIVVAMKNPDPTYLTNGTLKTELINQKWQFFRYENNAKTVKIVPSVAFNNNLFLGQKRLVAGVYRLKINFKSRQYRETRYRYVKITKKQAKFINKNNAAYLLHRNQIIFSSIGIIGLIMIIIVYFIKRKRGKIDKSID